MHYTCVYNVLYFFTMCYNYRDRLHEKCYQSHKQKTATKIHFLEEIVIGLSPEVYFRYDCSWFDLWNTSKNASHKLLTKQAESPQKTDLTDSVITEKIHNSVHHFPTARDAKASCDFWGFSSDCVRVRTVLHPLTPAEFVRLSVCLSVCLNVEWISQSVCEAVCWH